ncbi:hypothetical protein LSTR_LSTR003267 [Laodelphax striatellus]|uniref:Uncharacterized protein n=1 Tax=Laodelphax striatellus TaxID=195883 RepID=A0A482XTY5_LAOST|nr:hypothetical protein LSTR_LSTR003267 [Laodelphax striatellus]
MGEIRMSGEERKDPGSSLTIDRAAFLLLRVKRVFKKRKQQRKEKTPTPEQSSVIPDISNKPSSKVTTATSLLTYVEPVNQSLEKSWETEEVPVKAKKDNSHMYLKIRTHRDYNSMAVRSP